MGRPGRPGRLGRAVGSGGRSEEFGGVFLFVFSVVFFFLSFLSFMIFFCCCCILLYREVIAIIPLIETDRTERQNYLMKHTMTRNIYI